MGTEYWPDALGRSVWEHPHSKYRPVPCGNIGRFDCGELGLLGAICIYVPTIASIASTIFLHCLCPYLRRRLGIVSGSRVPARRPQVLWLKTPPLQVLANPLLSKHCVQYFYYQYTTNNSIGWCAYAFIYSKVTS